MVSRYIDGFAHTFGSKMRDVMRRESQGEVTEFGRDRSHEVLTRPANQDRLRYYRSHGLDSCDDYPGGDTVFESDVLSGAHHDVRVELGEPKREDAYVLEAIKSGRLRYDGKLQRYLAHPLLILAFYESMSRNHFRVRCMYRGGLFQLREDILSGSYAKSAVMGRRDGD